jgi:cysteine desulfuration protein SufE
VAVAGHAVWAVVEVVVEVVLEGEAAEDAERRIACTRGRPDGLPLFQVPAPVQLSPMPTFDTLVSRFRSADRNTRLETLLDYSRKLPPLPPEYEALKAQGKNLVPECQTPVYLWIGIENGKVRLHADVPRESPTVRGFVALLIKALDGLSPAEVAAVPGDLLDQLQLTETLGMMRTQGLTSIVARIKRSVADPALQDAIPGT